jgi:hypothetical protein
VNIIENTLKKFPNSNQQHLSSMIEHLKWYHFQISLVLSVIIYQHFKRRYDANYENEDNVDARQSDYRVNDVASDFQVITYLFDYSIK